MTSSAISAVRGPVERLLCAPPGDGTYCGACGDERVGGVCLPCLLCGPPSEPVTAAIAPEVIGWLGDEARFVARSCRWFPEPVIDLSESDDTDGDGYMKAEQRDGAIYGDDR